MTSRRDAIAAANALGVSAFLDGEFEAAIDAWRQTLALIDPRDEELAPAVHENLGLALFNLGRDHAAARELLRALDPNPAARPQAAHLAIMALARIGHLQHALSLYDRVSDVLGPHPSLTREQLVLWEAQARHARRRSQPG